MTKPYATQVVTAALALLASSPPIPYTTMDCQGFVKAAVRRAGGTMQFAGSNDMFRNACTTILPLNEARQSGLLTPGALLFILKHDGGEPAHYKPDGIGNASHVGLYTAAPQAEAVHSTPSKGVSTTTLANGWTHVGLAIAIDYAAAPSTPVQTATVSVPSGQHLRMRKTPDPDGAYMQRIPGGTQLVIDATQSGFARTTYDGHTGWVDVRYLTMNGEAQEDRPDTITIPLAVAEPFARALWEQVRQVTGE